MLIWEQPHPIYYAELCYRAHPDWKTLQTYKDIVFKTAEFMADFACWSIEKNRYELGPRQARVSTTCPLWWGRP